MSLKEKILKIETSNRYVVMLGAILVQLCLGSIYAWTVFQNALFESTLYGWEKLLTQLPFSVALASFAGFMIMAGRWQDKIGPRKVATVGGVLLGAGYLLAGLLDTIAPANPTVGFLWLAITYGLIGGAGIGFAYVCPIAALVKWFPDAKGLISGVAVAGFGAGALVFIQVEDYLIANVGNGYVGPAFMVLGVIYLALVAGSAQLLRNPPKDYMPPSYKKKTTKTAHFSAKEYEPREMVSTRRFWLLWIMFMLAASAGLMTIGNVKTFAKNQMGSAGVDLAQAAVIASTIGGILSLFNAAGRIVWGALSDKLGRSNTMTLMFTTLALSMVFFSTQTDAFMLTVGASLIGFCFGGNFALFPSATADYFGTKNMGVNYGLVFTAYGVAGILGPFLAGILPYEQVFPLLGLLAFASAGLSAAAEYLNRHRKKKKTR